MACSFSFEINFECIKENTSSAHTYKINHVVDTTFKEVDALGNVNFLLHFYTFQEFAFSCNALDLRIKILNFCSQTDTKKSN